MKATPPAGIRANLPQFGLLIGVNALVGALVGQERSLIPLLAEDGFGTGMLLQAIGLASFSINQTIGPALIAAAVLGLGTALAYPALIAAAAALVTAISAVDVSLNLRQPHSSELLTAPTMSI